MRIFKRILLGIVAILVVMVTTVFMLENRQTVALNFMGCSAPEMSVAIPVILALLLGMSIGPIFALMVINRKKRVSSSRSI